MPNLVLARLIDDDILDSTRSTEMPGIEESKCILVTGATAGIGRSLALALARLPSKPQVIATGRRQDRLNELKTAGLEVFQLELDTDMASLKNSVDSILDKYPQVLFFIVKVKPCDTLIRSTCFLCSLMQSS